MPLSLIIVRRWGLGVLQELSIEYCTNFFTNQLLKRVVYKRLNATFKCNFAGDSKYLL